MTTPRYDVTDLAWPREDTEGAWRGMAHATEHYGTPRMVLSDNGLAFTGRRVDTAMQFGETDSFCGSRGLHGEGSSPQGGPPIRLLCLESKKG
ncbi:hypothetical protein ACIBG0_04890 [Nocardia sp. NPDC050630]|uniref:hypothetical protein n=1 Tax=Nocardia sp. NPDC050630 TaxID=3364321 RepID=UPI0037BE1DAE